MGKIGKYFFILLFFIFSYFINMQSVCAYETNNLAYFNFSSNLIIEQKSNKEEILFNTKENNCVILNNKNLKHFSKANRFLSSSSPNCTDISSFNPIYKNSNKANDKQNLNIAHSVSSLLKNEINTRAP